MMMSFQQLWDVVSDQNAVDLIRGIENAQEASKKLLDQAESRHTSDNVTILVIRFKSNTPSTA